MNDYVMKKILAIPEESINVNSSYKMALNVNSTVKFLSYFVYLISFIAIICFVVIFIKYTYLIYFDKKNEHNKRELKDKRNKVIVLSLLTSYITFIFGLILNRPYKMALNVNSIEKLLSYFVYLISFIAIICFVVIFIKYTYLIYFDKKNEHNKRELKDKRNKGIVLSLLTSFITFISGLILSVISQPRNVKPIIYIYPKKDGEKIKIKLNKPERLACTYPKYKDEWNVIANKNGDLLDEKTDKHYYALYWEGNNHSNLEFKEGFVVKGEDSSKFLEEKLEILGLNEREAEEFIVYWLPILEQNKYNLIRFQTKEEINESMGLEITPKPDTLIRIMMTFKPLMKPTEIPEQKLEHIERKGYTVVEWGGVLNK